VIDGLRETVRPIDELFRPDVSALWATTYNVDLSLFSEFLLPRLGQPPLNVVVIADSARLARSLSRIPAERAESLGTVNRRWLLRGFGSARHVFHPKSYLAVSSRSTRLLVGSGNLSQNGINEGREVFSVFDSTSAIGTAAIEDWFRWMRRIVESSDDVTLAERFRDLVGRRTPAPAAQLVTPSPLIHNLDRSIGEEFMRRIAPALGSNANPKLTLTAPYYDSDADAVGFLVSALRPSEVSVFVTDSTNVPGKKLAKRLVESVGSVHVYKYEPDAYTHAKLIGVADGDRGWLLSGSANLSRAGLTLSLNSGGNAELSVLTEMPAEAIRAAFLPPNVTAVPVDLSRLHELEYEHVPEETTSHIGLLSAAAAGDGIIAIVTAQPFDASWRLSDLDSATPLAARDGRVTTTSPLEGRLVEIVDTSGRALSNRVVVDDLNGLGAALRASDSQDETGRPSELAAGDLETSLAQTLLFLHRSLVMDVTERVPARGASGSGQGAGGDPEQDDDELWERLEREQLARDSRALTYRRILDASGRLLLDPVVELLEALRDYAPPAAEPRTIGDSLLAYLATTYESPSNEESERRQWSPSARVRVRAKNVLTRWALAQSNPRLLWVDPLAPAGNFAMVCAGLANLHWAQSRYPDRVELTRADLADIWFLWLSGFVGTGSNNGWLERLDSDDTTRAVARIPAWVSETVAALTWLAVSLSEPEGLRSRVLKWQPVVAAALQSRLLDPTENTAAFIASTMGISVSTSRLNTDLIGIVEFLDDELWCERTRQELSVEELHLDESNIGVKVDVRGVSDPLLDPRVPQLIVAAQRYRRCRGVAVFSMDRDWRVVYEDHQPIAVLGRLGGGVLESARALTPQELELMAGSGRVLGDLFASGDWEVA
jgi:hypothetical protein